MQAVRSVSFPGTRGMLRADAAPLGQTGAPGSGVVDWRAVGLGTIAVACLGVAGLAVVCVIGPLPPEAVEWRRGASVAIAVATGMVVGGATGLGLLLVASTRVLLRRSRAWRRPPSRATPE